MEIHETHANAAFKVLIVSLTKGEKMPRHYATSDAFLMIREGKGVLKIQDSEVRLQPGTTLSIPASEPHSLQILENFEATVILAADAQINFTEKTDSNS